MLPEDRKSLSGIFKICGALIFLFRIVKNKPSGASFIPLRFRKVGWMCCGGARETH